MSFDLNYFMQYGLSGIAIIFCILLTVCVVIILVKTTKQTNAFELYKVTITGELKDYVTYQNLKSSIEESLKPYLQEMKHIQDGLKELKDTLKEMTFGKIDKK